MEETKESAQHNERLKFEAKVMEANVRPKSMPFSFCWKRGFLYLPQSNLDMLSRDIITAMFRQAITSSFEI
jgi:hypothetical protein